jgi:hypothetical protein
MAFNTDVHATKKYRLGTRKRDVAGNEYIYLKGVGSTVANMVVYFDENFASTLLTTSFSGSAPCAVAQAAIDATTKYGWYLIWGNGTAKSAATVAADVMLQPTANSGEVDDTTTAGDFIIGMNSTAASASNTVAVFCNYPVFEGQGI